MSRQKLIYPNIKYKKDSVQIYISDSLIRFFRLTKNNLMLKELYKSLAISDTIVVNQMKSEITNMRAVWSGFMRSSLTSWIEINQNPYGTIDSYIGTKAWYDILVHEGLGLHSSSGNYENVPAEFLPTSAQLSIAPSWADVKDANSKKEKIKGPRRFMTNALKKSTVSVIREISKGYYKGLRNISAGSLGMPRRTLDQALSMIGGM